MEDEFRAQSEDLYRSGLYLQNNPAFHIDDSPWKVEQIRKMLDRHGLHPNSVCDVGCGAGLILRLLQSHFLPQAVLHGYDISPRGIEGCKQFENSGLRYFCKDILDAEVEAYDLLLCIDVFEHVEDYLGFLRRLRRKSEFKIFHIPLEFSARSAVFSRQILNHRAQVGHLHYFNRETALATLQSAGYEIVDSFYTPAYQQSLAVAGRRERLLRNLFRPVSVDVRARVLGGYSLLVLAK